MSKITRQMVQRIGVASLATLLVLSFTPLQTVSANGAGAVDQSIHEVQFVNQGADFVVLDPDITVTGFSDTEITGIEVYINDNYQSGDALKLTQVNAVELTGTSRLTYAPGGTITQAQAQAILRSVKFKTTSGISGSRNIVFRINRGTDASVYWNSDNGHFYRIVPKPANLESNQFTWTLAKEAADDSNMSYLGLTGYLATITSASETEFLLSLNLPSAVWIGGSDHIATVNGVTDPDAGLEGSFFWVTGPEAGTPISTGNVNPVAVSGSYMNWATQPSGEPNNGSGSEHYMQVLISSGSAGKWNDLSLIGGSGIYAVNAYAIEYGGMPDDEVYTSDPAASTQIQQSIIVTESGTAPVALTASAIGEDTLTANWQPFTDAARYYLDVATSNDFNTASYVSGYRNRDVGAVTSFAVTGLDEETPYYYRIRAQVDDDYDLQTHHSNVITTATVVTVTPDDTPAPGKIELLTLSPGLVGGLLTDDLKSLVAIPEQWRTDTRTVELWLDAQGIAASHPNFASISQAQATLSAAGATLLQALDIHLMKRVTQTDGSTQVAPVDPASIVGPITVRLPIPTDLLSIADLGIVFIDGTGQPVSVPSTRVTIHGIDYLEFTSSHFSVFGIVSDASHAASVQPDAATAIPATGEQPNLIHWGVLMLLLSAGLVILSRKREESH